MLRSERLLPAIAAALMLSACDQAEPPMVAVGQLASDRVEVAFEAQGRILARGPDEGSAVEADTVLYVLDEESIQLQLRAARASIDERTAALAELTNGTRPEVLAQARSDRAGARDTVAFRQRELDRLSNLAERELVAPNAVDAARTALDEAQARLSSLEARFDELTAGPRPEAIDRARAALALAEAEHDQLVLRADRHRLRAGVSGRLDRYVYEVGEQAREPSVAAIVLVGEQPLASVFLPAAMRSDLDVGDAVELRIEGREEVVDGQVRWISAEAAFTPYFALTERDRGRLSYRAEIILESVDAERLADGLPVEMRLPGGFEP